MPTSIINGHDHDYERFAPLSPYGKMSDAGIREFVVGTGGRGHRSFRVLMAHSVVRHAGASGVLKLTLGVDGYSWDFIPVAGQSFTDSGWGSCTSVPAPQPGRVVLATSTTTGEPAPGPLGLSVIWGRPEPCARMRLGRWRVAQR